MASRAGVAPREPPLDADATGTADLDADLTREFTAVHLLLQSFEHGSFEVESAKHQELREVLGASMVALGPAGHGRTVARGSVGMSGAMLAA